MDRTSSLVSNLMSRAHLPPGCRFFSGIDTTNAETFVVVVVVVVAQLQQQMSVVPTSSVRCSAFQYIVCLLASGTAKFALNHF